MDYNESVRRLHRWLGLKKDRGQQRLGAADKADQYKSKKKLNNYKAMVVSVVGVGQPRELEVLSCS